MCVSMYPARLTNTIGLINWTRHPEHGEIVVVGYQNKVQNLHTGANAMILHFPTLQGMTQANFLDTSATPHILEDMAEAVRPRSRGSMSKGALTFGNPVQIFSHDIYTVVLTSDASLLPDVLSSNLIPAGRRPRINAELLNWYALEKPGYSFAVCCFNNEDAAKASPLLVYYKTRFPGILEFPGIDAHTGRVPNMSAQVDVDHTIVLGSYQMRKEAYPAYVDYTDAIPEWLKPYLPTQVLGRTYTGKMQNGDFRYDTGLLTTGRVELIRA